jgi:ubiquitin carboxyl-terminal hydrolase 4/11/15
MNSGLQCLSNTAALTEIFLTDQYEPDLNPTNPIGTQCKLVKAYAALAKEMWYGTSSSVSPWYFKRELGDFVPQFYGFSQHDSHELVNYVLDLIHEDLNRVKNKPIAEEVKQEGLSEEEVSNLFWQNHISRNQSFVVDLMHGQYRSEVTCPKCSKSSLTFDPFLSFSVSFPKKDVKSMDLVCVFAEIGRPVTRIKIQLPRRGTISTIKSETGRLFSINPEHLQAAKVYSYSATEFFPDDMDFSQVPTTSTLVIYEVPRIETKIAVVLNFLKDPESQYYSKTAFAYSRVIMVDREFTAAQVHLKIYQYLLRARTSRRTDSQDAEMTDDETGELTALEEVYHRDMTGKDYSKHFKINMVNLQREKAQGGVSTYYYSSYYSGPACDYCDRKECKNCQLPHSSDIKFAEIVEKNKSGRPFRLEIVVPYQGVEQLKVLTETIIHESVNKFHDEQRKLTEMQYSLEECIEFSSQAETLDEQNEVYCSTCKEHVQASKQMTIFRLPKILIIQLKRFKEKGYHKDKDGRLISFPVEGLDMTRFCHISNGPPLYDLYAVSNHFGGLGGGHYTAYAKNSENGRWYNFDDSSVREVGNVGSVVSPAAYVLFYKARDGVETASGPS